MPLPPGAARRPLLAMIERDPWLRIVGSDVPSFVGYEDGSILTLGRGEPERIEGLLEPDEVVRLAERVSALLRRPDPAAVGDGPDAMVQTDLPAIEIFARVGDLWTCRSREGLTRGDAEQLARAGGFGEAVSTIAAVRGWVSAPWRPVTLELIWNRFEHARTATPWPESLPQPAKEMKRTVRGIYIQRVDGACEGAVRAFLSTLGVGGVSVRNGTWSLSVRRVVPDEDILFAVRRQARAPIAPTAPSKDERA